MLMRPTFSKQELSHICSAKEGYRSKEQNPNSKATCKSHSPQNQAQPVRSGYSWSTILRTHCPDCISQNILIEVSESNSHCLRDYLFTVVRRTSRVKRCNGVIRKSPWCNGPRLSRGVRSEISGKGAYVTHFFKVRTVTKLWTGKDTACPYTVYISGQSIKEAHKQIKLLIAVELAKGFTNAPHFLKNFNFCLVCSNYFE